MDELHDRVISAVKKRKKVTKSQKKRMNRRAGKLRKLRKFRSRVKRADKGMPYGVKQPGGGTKRIRRRFYFVTYTSKGEAAGTHWMVAAKPSDKAIASYKKKYGANHPFSLSIKSDSQIKDLQKLRQKKRKARSRTKSRSPRRRR